MAIISQIKTHQSGNHHHHPRREAAAESPDNTSFDFAGIFLALSLDIIHEVL